MKRTIPIFVAALMLTLFASPVFALGTNGDFEMGTDPGAFTMLNSGDNTTIPDWMVVSGTVDYIGTYWASPDGVRSIDLSGNGVGSISQTFDTVVGATYEVTFDMAGNPAGEPGTKTMDVVATGGTLQSYSFDTVGKSTAAMGWTQETYTFTADSTSTTLTFTSTTASAFGPALDNVMITQTEDPIDDPDEDEDEDEDDEEDEEIGRPEDNHGWYVSTAEKEDRYEEAKSRNGMPEQSKGHTKSE